MKEFINQGDTSSQWVIRETYEEGKDTILVIDDEIGPRESIKIIFKSRYNVLTAENGDKGIEILKSKKIDIIILDLRMPGKNGIETLAEIRKYDQKVPVIILTGYGDMEAAKKAIHYGAIEFMSKPFGVKELEEIVAKGIKKRKIEIESEKLKEELITLNSNLLKKLNEIEALATIGQISTEILHEINNLLTVIHGYTQLLLQEISSQELTLKYITTIQNEIKRCKNISKSIMELTKPTGEKEDININEVISKVVDFLKESKICKNIKFIVSLDNSPIIIKGNPNHFHQAILNIILNSIQAIEKEGQIEINTKKLKELAIIEIKDNGKGIPPELIEKIKEPFFSTKEKGLGIGLFLTTRIVKRYGGNIEIESKPGEGTLFKILFPVS